ncbi:MAG TPA: bifunctional proline dehydrogenase/L-glutamate gamma-semialdehyde dehydrogenase [Acidimicrobiales bacterium]|jgi:RHH-type proline utilization regulon transcriptional repressor/proline dehydrogenase/delta 1-pyrroline-5-carboxylate dehydrogenase|nr:bifunctional proline dehydrogenase/L-glutamate gamma-semialdehyde dehydrogenase [Acidimicrobiales bacterium]
MIDADGSVAASVLANALTSARELIDAAAVPRTRAERNTRRRFRRLFDDPRAVEVTITLTDEVMRFSSAKSAAAALRAAVRHVSSKGFGLVNVAGLRAVALFSRFAPSSALRIVNARVRDLTENLILDEDATSLRAIIDAHQHAGLSLNVNVLGEAVLGEAEADDRLARVLEVVRRCEVNYVSVKLSSITSQLITIDHEGSLQRVAEKLRVLYREAERHGTFVNLDMEEYRDLRLTLDAFMTVLDEPEFHALRAGLVLQAYLPDSHGALNELIDFAARRSASGGGQLKVRLVKGANLAMEHVEAELHGWTSAPYATKADVDASFCQLLDTVLRPEHASSLRVGVASHNLFHVAWALELAASRDVVGQLDVEMLEGMANAEARALIERGHSVLLYAPVTRRDDFASAVAYLVRRLDENTAPENYLRSALSIANDPGVYEEQEHRFRVALDERQGVSTEPRRRPLTFDSSHFDNEPDGDPTNREYVQTVTTALSQVRERSDVTIDTLTHLSQREPRLFEEGHDPSDHGRAWYRYRVARVNEIDEALEFASSGFATWHRLAVEERQTILRRAADVMAEGRATTIAVMARDGGKTVAEADPEVSEAVDFARFYASHALGDDASTPLGVVLVVPPWNFPYAIPAGGVLAALAAGNAVILKPAPEAVAVAYELATQLWDAGLPREVLQLVPTRDDESGRHLVTHVGVSAVILTGSFETAKLFTSWKPRLRLLAETSGKNALVITASADVDLAVKDLVQSAFGHAGQKCSAASLAIVEQSLYDDPQFASQLVDAVTSLRVGAGYELSTNVGPIIRPPEEALRRALTQLDDGESWLVQPERLDDEGLLWRPGVKVGVRPGSWSHLNEWFGPVLGVMIAQDLEEATAWQNQVPYGLTAGLHSLSQDECERWLEHVEAGNLYVNRGVTGAIVRRQPFGGWRRSRVGPTAKAGGVNYLSGLRHWPRVTDDDTALADAARWWRQHGSVAHDDAGLKAERNLARYRRPSKPIAIRVDEGVSPNQLAYVRGLIDLAHLHVEFSAESLVRGLLDVTLESVDELVARCNSFSSVRWISREMAPTLALLEKGVSVDPRALAQSGAVELPRWLLEQSVAVTNHRYGNVHAGPKPECLGLGEGKAHLTSESLRARILG